MARRYVAIQHMPEGIYDNPNMVLFASWYAKSFQELVEFGEVVDRWRRDPVAIEQGAAAVSPFYRSIFKGSGKPSMLKSLMGINPPKRSLTEALGDNPVPDLTSYRDGSVEGFQYFGDGKLPPHLNANATSLNDEQFVDILSTIVERHNPITVLIAKQVKEMSEARGLKVTDPTVQAHLNAFHRSRVGMRMLIGHHVALSHPKTKHDHHVGIVCTETDPADVASEAAMDAAAVCELSYNVAPQVEIRVPAGGCPTFVFVPSHLHHIMFELLKNAMRAVVEREEARVGHGNADPDNLEPVMIYIEEENDGDSVLIRVSDHGTGIKADLMPNLFNYAFTTARPVNLDNQFHGSEVQGAPMAGYGYGLTLSRLVGG
ncbi:hypothetical protein HK101_001702 [Irineochytrium annulatum]|nr:hypothetical protein HK101_001702 [Irineochytrium annulatum]